MGIEVQKSEFPTLFNFARVRAASQPHVIKNNLVPEREQTIRDKSKKTFRMY